MLLECLRSCIRRIQWRIEDWLRPPVRNPLTLAQLNAALREYDAKMAKLPQREHPLLRWRKP